MLRSLALAAALVAATCFPNPSRANPAQATPVQVAVATPAVAPGASARRPPVTARLDEARVSVTAWSPWPDMLYQGYEPITFEFTNESDDERELDVQLFRGWGDERWTVQDAVVIPPHATAKRALFAPVTRVYDSQYSATLTSRGDTIYLSGLGASKPANPASWPVVYVHTAARTPQAGASEVWAAALTASPPSDVPQSAQAAAPVVRFIPGPMPLTAGGGYGVEITPVALDELPARIEPYTSLKGVILDAQGALPSSDVLDALLAWTRLGGCLVFQGPDAETRARAVPGAAAWMEERFLLHANGRLADRVYACGQGALVIAGGRDLQRLETSAGAEEFATTIDAIGRGLVHGVPFAASPQHQERYDALPRLSGLDLPYRALTLLLVVFAILIGPVNLIVVNKLKRPVLLLVTVPLIALVFSIGLFAYGALAQGLGTRARAHSITWLDQRAHVATTVEVRSLFAGMPAGSGWKPGPGAVCVALPNYAVHPGAGSLRLDFRDGTTYGGDYLPVRREVRNAFLVDRAARARLGVTRNGDDVTVENALGARIEHLVLRDADGNWHAAPGAIDAGGKATLTKLTSASDAMERVHAAVGEVEPLVGASEPFAGSYVARLATSAFGDACGVEFVEEESVHVVLGVLEPEGGGR